MTTLYEQFKKSKQKRVTVGGFDFTIRRPSPVEIYELLSGTTLRSEQAKICVRHFVADWSLTELDIYSGGSGNKAEFSTELLCEWILDYPQIMIDLGGAILDEFERWKTQLEDAEKKSQTGSNPEPSTNNPAA